MRRATGADDAASLAPRGNFHGPGFDYPVMTCNEVRAALSARLDGEQTPGADPDEHLPGCVECRAWLASAEHVTRSVRLQAVEVPDLTARVLAAVAADSVTTQALAEVPQARRSPEAHGRQQVLRLAVALAAVAQLVLAVPVLLGGSGVVPNPHASREMASFDVALAVGFALAAYRPHRARAYLPVAIVLAGCLALTSAFDISGGHTFLVHEAGHLAAVVQAGLLWALSRTSDGAPGQPRRRPGIAAAGPAAQA